MYWTYVAYGDVRLDWCASGTEQVVLSWAVLVL